MSDDVEMGKELAKVGGSMTGGMGLLFVFQKLFSKSDERMDEAIELLHALRTDFEVFKGANVAIAADIAEVKSRIDGMSSNYGGRLQSLEVKLAELRTEMRVRLKVTEEEHDAG